VSARPALARMALTGLTRPKSLGPRDLAAIKRGLSLAAAGRAGAAPALGALAALLYTRPELVDDAALARLLANAGALGPLGARRDAIRLCAALAGTPLAPRLLLLLRARLAEDGLDPATRRALVPLLRDFIQWRPDLLGLHLVLEMAGPAAMAPYRNHLLGHVVEPLVYKTPEMFDEPAFERLAAMFATCPRWPYFLASLADRRGIPAIVQARAGRLSDGFFPHRDGAAIVVRGGTFRLLVVFNVLVGQGDEIARVGPLVQTVLDANPAAAVTVITPRRHLYDHPRVEAVSIHDAGAVAGALAEPADGIAHVREPMVAAMNISPALSDEVERVIRGCCPPLVIRADVGLNWFLYQTVALHGRDIAGPRGLDRVDVENVYDARYRLLAELGLPRRAADEDGRAGSMLVGSPSAEAESVWARVIAAAACRTDARTRPVVLLNPFGGDSLLKGFVDRQSRLLADQIAELVREGHAVVVLPNGRPWSRRRDVERVMAALDPGVRAHVAVAPDPSESEAARLTLEERPELPYADRVMRLFKYFAAYADLIVTIEGWLTHLAYSLGRPFRLILAPLSHGYEYHPQARGPRQQLMPALSPAAPPSVWTSEMLRKVDPPPLPYRPRKAFLQIALQGVAGGGKAAVSALARALASEDFDVRVAAVTALARVRPLAAVKAHLLAALRDREIPVRRAAADALLGRRANCRAELGRGYRDLLRAHRAIARQHWAGVVALGSAALPALFAAADDANGVIRREARPVLAEMLRASSLAPEAPGNRRDSNAPSGPRATATRRTEPTSRARAMASSTPPMSRSRQ